MPFKYIIKKVYKYGLELSFWCRKDFGNFKNISPSVQSFTLGLPSLPQPAMCLLKLVHGGGWQPRTVTAAPVHPRWKASPRCLGGKHGRPSCQGEGPQLLLLPGPAPLASGGGWQIPLGHNWGLFVGTWFAFGFSSTWSAFPSLVLSHVPHHPVWH